MLVKAKEMFLLYNINRNQKCHRAEKARYANTHTQGFWLKSATSTANSRLGTLFAFVRIHLIPYPYWLAKAAAGASSANGEVSSSGGVGGFVDGVVKGLSDGASTCNETRGREREEVHKMASLGNRPSPERKVKAEQMDADCRDVCVPLVVDMMSAGMNAAALHMQENQRRMDERVTKIELYSNDINQRASTLETSQCDLHSKFDQLAERTQKLELENQALREQLHVQAAGKPQPAPTSAAAPSNFATPGVRASPSAVPDPRQVQPGGITAQPTNQRGAIENDRHMKLGNLGRGLERKETLSIRKEVLSRVGVKES